MEAKILVVWISGWMHVQFVEAVLMLHRATIWKAISSGFNCFLPGGLLNSAVSPKRRSICMDPWLDATTIRN